jgi:hypothetical protein
MPDSVEAHFNLGMTYLNLGNRREALIEYKALKDKDATLAVSLYRTIYKDKVVGVVLRIGHYQLVNLRDK